MLLSRWSLTRRRVVEYEADLRVSYPRSSVVPSGLGRLFRSNPIRYGTVAGRPWDGGNDTQQRGPERPLVLSRPPRTGGGRGDPSHAPRVAGTSAQALQAPRGHGEVVATGTG